MKKLLFLLWLFYCFFAKAQTYIIPWAQQQPAWVFPLWFEDGSGAKDTIYFCYEPSNDPVNLFGWVGQRVSPDTFNVTFAAAGYSDTVAEKVVLHVEGISAGPTILCRHFMFPLIIRWDSQLFYSDSLPYPNQNPAPRAQGNLWFQSPMQTVGCYDDAPIILTDTLMFPLSPCFKPDSVAFIGTAAHPFRFDLVPWTGIWIAVPPLATSLITVYPNPAQNILYIKSTQMTLSSQVFVRDILGRIVYTEEIKSGNFEINTTMLSDGIYNLTVSNSSHLFHSSFMVAH